MYGFCRSLRDYETTEPDAVHRIRFKKRERVGTIRRKHWFGTRKSNVERSYFFSTREVKDNKGNVTGVNNELFGVFRKTLGARRGEKGESDNLNFEYVIRTRNTINTVERFDITFFLLLFRRRV